jgi:DNA-directed RNA polymerase specialized sigma24 family protein
LGKYPIRYLQEGNVSASQAVAKYLPLLRRYARALTGSQESGDTYVSVVLEALIEEPKQLDGPDGPRVALYRIFSQVWNGVAANGFVGSLASKLPAEKRIVQLTPRPRQAFLLTALEGFTEDEAARVLDVDAPTLRGLIEAAGREMAADLATDVLIIEDEPFIAADIEGLVESLGHRVYGIARTQREAVQLAKAKRPGLILADIQLADGSSGLDAVNELLKSVEVPVVFITAYPERFLTGERPEPAFLIPKPYQPALVSAVISQALFFERNAKPRAKLAS